MRMGLSIEHSIRKKHSIRDHRLLQLIRLGQHLLGVSYNQHFLIYESERLRVTRICKVSNAPTDQDVFLTEEEALRVGGGIHFVDEYKLYETG